MQKLPIIFRYCVHALALLIGSIGLSACVEPVMHSSYGLPLTFSIYIDDDDLSAMRTSLHAKPQVPAEIWINDQNFNARILHSGATSIKNFRRSYELYLDQPFDGMRVFRLNAMVGDLSTMKSTMAYFAYELMGFKMPRYEPIALWVNDEYYGVYQLQQLFTEADYWKAASPTGELPVYMYQATKALMGSGKDIYANLEQKFTVKFGSKEFVGLEEFIRRLAGEPSDVGRQRIEEMGDVNQILLYMAMVQYLSHFDGINNNFYFVSTAQEPRFQILPWDLDVTFIRDTTPANGAIFEPNHMMRRFFYEDAPYQSQFFNHVRQIHNRLTLEAMLTHLEKYCELIQEGWEADGYRNSEGITLEEYRFQLENRIRRNRRNYQNFIERLDSSEAASK